MQQHLDVGQPLDPADQVPGHVLAQILLADDQAEMRRVGGQEDDGLAGRVAAADDRHRVVPAELGLRLRRGVVDAAPLEVGQARHVQAAIAGAGGDDDRPGRHRRAVG